MKLHHELLLSEVTALKIMKAAIFIFIGFVLAKIFKSLTDQFVKKSKGTGRASFLPDLVFYLTLIVAIISTLDQLNIDIKLLLSTAGFLTVALGFASQTSVSNIISGFFLMTERPFTIGDLVKIDTLTGAVQSIDLLSTRLRTVDNLLVRIPNETLMKANIINYTHFPVRRVDIEFKIRHHERIDKVRNMLFELADNHISCFDEPRPIFLLKELGDWAIVVQFSFWVEKEKYLEIKNSFIEKMMESFETFNVHLPIPMRHNVADLDEPLPL